MHVMRHENPDDDRIRNIIVAAGERRCYCVRRHKYVGNSWLGKVHAMERLEPWANCFDVVTS